MSYKEYALKFHLFSRHVPELVFIIRDRMHMFTSGLCHDLVLNSKVALLIKNMEISRLLV